MEDHQIRGWPDPMVTPDGPRPARKGAGAKQGRRAGTPVRGRRDPAMWTPTARPCRTAGVTWTGS
jgi:hypothetical protein